MPKSVAIVISGWLGRRGGAAGRRLNCSPIVLTDVRLGGGVHDRLVECHGASLGQCVVPAVFEN